MPFITQGKTNIKYLLIVTLVAIVAGGIIFTKINYFQKEIVGWNEFTDVKSQMEKLKQVKS